MEYRKLQGRGRMKRFALPGKEVTDRQYGEDLTMFSMTEIQEGQGMKKIPGSGGTN